MQENGNSSTVRYYSNQFQDDFTSKNVRFINYNSRIESRQQSPENFQRITVDKIENRKNKILEFLRVSVREYTLLLMAKYLII